jgi:hypothetical protein
MILNRYFRLATKYNILSQVEQHELAILVSIIISEVVFSTDDCILNSF